MRLDAPAAGPPARYAWIDAARGIALVAMAIYHFAWDLRFFGYVALDIAGDPGWRIFARLIAGTFLALVGIGLVLSTRGGFRPARFFRRLAIVAAAAAATTLVTWFVFPDTYIFFGILHCIALSSLLGLAFVRAPLIVVAAAALFCFIAPPLLAASVFDTPALLWLGLSTTFPRTNDFVPLFPWFGVVLAGIAIARLAPRFSPNTGLLAGRAPAPLIWAGRHSLAIYLVHQPLLLGLVYLATQIAPPEPTDFATWHRETCSQQCVAADRDADSCQTICGCLTERAEASGLAPALLGNSLNEDQTALYFELAGECRGDPPS